jgi:hypothetical protein
MLVNTPNEVTCACLISSPLQVPSAWSMVLAQLILQLCRLWEVICVDSLDKGSNDEHRPYRWLLGDWDEVGPYHLFYYLTLQLSLIPQFTLIPPSNQPVLHDQLRLQDKRISQLLSYVKLQHVAQDLPDYATKSSYYDAVSQE